MHTCIIVVHAHSDTLHVNSLVPWPIPILHIEKVGMGLGTRLHDIHCKKSHLPSRIQSYYCEAYLFSNLFCQFETQGAILVIDTSLVGVH